MIRKKEYKIIGMHCASCSQAIEKALAKIDGIIKINVNLATEIAYIEYDNEITSNKRIIETIKNTGYEVLEDSKKITLQIGGMTCASCSQAIEKTLLKTTGINSANVNLATEKATISFDPKKTNRLIFYIKHIYVISCFLLILFFRLPMKRFWS